MITFFSYWFNKFKKQEDHKHLDNFLKQFNATPSQDELKVLISSGDLSEKSWLLLANSYFKDGNYEKSIEIYSELLKVGSKSNSRDTMFLLAKTYFKAGFLERSKKIFLEILQANPRTPQALRYLLLIYEHMKDYSSALEVLEPLEVLQESVTVESTYLRILIILNNTELTSIERVEELLTIYKENHIFTYMIFEYIFRVDYKLAWKNLDSSKSELLVDILYNLGREHLDLNIINKNGYLRELYSAKGYIQEAKSSSVFEFNVLINLDNSVNAKLSFEYVCDSCKNVYPFAFHRCSSCHSIDSSRVEMSLVKNYSKDFGEENNSFQ
ncbi:tetratricopeptide repeat protein [Sulfurimonas sp.]|nr:tetratricopeptide repeat protein [Sulfurimonas sp.]